MQWGPTSTPPSSWTPAWPQAQEVVRGGGQRAEQWESRKGDALPRAPLPVLTLEQSPQAASHPRGQGGTGGPAGNRRTGKPDCRARLPEMLRWSFREEF